MNEFLKLALDHHLYLLPLLAGGMWLLTRWGAEDKAPRQRARVGQDKKPDRPDARHSSSQDVWSGQAAGSTVPALQDQQAALGRRGAALERQIWAVDGHAEIPRPSGGGVRSKKKRKR